MSDKQMRSPMPVYPVDRYLVQSNINNELVNIVNEDIWNPGPALRPEDEITLRKLHEMLRSTADDLRLLSGELAKYHEPGIQVKTTPTPLDEEFNERVHIEEVVNAKFHGYKIIDTKNTFTPSKNVQKNVVDGLMKTIADKQRRKPVVTTGVQVNEAPIRKITNKNLVKSQTKVLQVNNEKENIKDNKNNKNNNYNNASSVGYNEFSYKYVEPISSMETKTKLQLQELPKINIRSELKIQNVMQLDILPENSCDNNLENLRGKNTAVLAMKHEIQPIRTNVSHILHDTSPSRPLTKLKDRKISKMQTCESSESTENLIYDFRRKKKIQKQFKNIPHTSRPIPDRRKSYALTNHPNKQEHRETNLNEWRRKLNSVYGSPSTTKLLKQPRTKVRKEAHSTPQKKIPDHQMSNKIGLNNAEYIPYSKLTLGGVRVSDIEKEISNIPDKAEIPLQPILDKILSRENSFHNGSPTMRNKTNKKHILTTSDENLLKEVIDIQNKVSNTLSENVEKISMSSEENDTYIDDFDEDNTDATQSPLPSAADKSSINNAKSEEPNNFNIPCTDEENIHKKNHNESYTKSNALSFKKSVDIYEYIHERDTQDSTTQINMTNKISLKETQTSPGSDKSNLQPINNELWPSIDPTKEVEKMFELEKHFIKKLIIDEYGDLIEKALNKPSTSNNICETSKKNENSSQKNTQTSPAHVKSVMTSPTRTKTRTTSPLVQSLNVNRHTSPMTVTSSHGTIALKDDDDNLSISMNLSSPRFSLRLPQTSRDVITNMDVKFHEKKQNVLKNKMTPISSSSSSAEGDYSSSDVSSLAGIEKYIKKHRTLRLSPTSEQSSSSQTIRQSSELSNSVLPLRSEGEISVGQIRKKEKKSSKACSEGEMSLGELLRRANR